MVNVNKGRFFRRKDNKYLIYLPKDLGTDSMFPFPLCENADVPVNVYFNEKKQLVIEKWKESDKR